MLHRLMTLRSSDHAQFVERSLRRIMNCARATRPLQAFVAASVNLRSTARYPRAGHRIEISQVNWRREDISTDRLGQTVAASTCRLATNSLLHQKPTDETGAVDGSGLLADVDSDLDELLTVESELFPNEHRLV